MGIIKSTFESKIEFIFDNLFNEIKEQNLSVLIRYIGQIYDYTVKNGKYNRGLYTVLSAKMLSPDSSDLQIAFINGWIIEIFQTFALILDDIMDKAVTRRGRLCWYKKMGMTTINDAFVLELQCFDLMRINLSDKHYYVKVFEQYNKISLVTIYGQLLDLNRQSKLKSFCHFLLQSIYKYKTSLYSFVFPVKIAMIITSKDTDEDLALTERLMLKIGHLFQMQDDYLDCFVKTSVIGKIGTDIQDGKCCWPVVKALQLCDNHQLTILSKQYGVNSPLSVLIVKDLYQGIRLKDVYRKDFNTSRNELMNEIENYKKLHPKSQVPKDVFGLILNKMQFEG